MRSARAIRGRSACHRCAAITGALWTTGALCLIAAGAMPAAVSAATITNRDARTHTLKVGTGNAVQSIVLEPGKATGAICPKGCIVELVGVAGGSYEIEGDDALSIEQDRIYYEGASSLPPPAGQVAPPLRGER